LFAAALSLTAIGCDAFRPLPPAVFVSPATLTVEDGQSAKLTARLRNPRSRTVTWSSSNTAVATIDAAGTVKGVTNGSTIVTVRMSDDTSVKAMVPVKVVGPAIATIAIAPTKATVYVSLGLRLSAQLRAADGRVIRGRAVAWTSPDAGIAEVSGQGVVRGRAPGGPIAVTATAEGRTRSRWRGAERAPSSDSPTSV
jgi:alpha-amylase